MLYTTIQVPSAGIEGIGARTIEVEICMRPGLHRRVVIVGLPDAAVKECKDRVQVAMRTSGFRWPSGHCAVVNLAPGDIRKEGPLYELPIALGILAVCGELPPDCLDDTAVIGELALDGRVRAVRGVLAMALLFRDLGLRRLILPRANAQEAAVVEDLEIIGVSTLCEAMALLRKEKPLHPVRFNPPAAETPDSGPDFRDVRGQSAAKRAAVVAAAGGHNLLLIGTPGAGKSMIARRIPGILPPLSREEMLEVSRIYSVAGLLDQELVRRRPFRDPHHTISGAGLTGGGSHPGPGEISLAHRGVLFLDEAPEFPRRILDMLRQPMEEGRITICRVAGQAVFPARFTLVAAANPCPCGYHGSDERSCTCSAGRIERYLARLSGPLLDRIDLQIQVRPVPFDLLQGGKTGANSATLRDRVQEARNRQAARLSSDTSRTNADLGPDELERICSLSPSATSLLKQAMESYALSARGYTRVRRVARTIADLDGSDRITDEHLAEALQYRQTPATVP